MATIQQLEKLHQIQRLFYVENSLEAAVAGDRVARLIARTEQLLRQRAFLRDERRRLRISTDKIEERKNGLTIMQRNDWFPASVPRIPEVTNDGTATATTQTPDAPSSSAHKPHLLINIGGLMCEIPFSVVKRDPMSLLAQLCSDNPPVLPDPDGGFFYFDRDWWLFRYVLTFLRDGTLPEDRQLLAQLYREAVYWNMPSLQRAIEEERLHLRSELLAAADKEADQNAWWRSVPSWWQAVDEAKKKEAEEAAKKAKAADWWKDSEYQGHKYLVDPEHPDALTATTWEAGPLAPGNAAGPHSTGSLAHPLPYPSTTGRGAGYFSTDRTWY
mmetsp:Transcript_12799/g.21292  ORF Transcript_12799/g.21292 Transcript_12799/m.21292 type:complete len:329 (+) Transcript_12799:37-1023(+)